MSPTTRPSRVLKRLSALNAEAKHLQHHRTHLDTRRFESQNRGWNRPPIQVTLSGPWKNRDQVKILEAWGIPSSHEPLEAFVHFRDGGWGVFELPRMPELYAFLAKVQKHPDAVTYLELLCRIALHSQYTLAEAVSLILDAIDADPARESSPAVRAQEWEYFGRYVIDVLQARMQNDGNHESVGDPMRVAYGVRELSDELDALRLEAAERRLTSVRATLTIRRERRGQ